MMRTRILLADDHRLVRSGMRALLESVIEADIVGEAGDGHEAVALVSALRPDIVLMDIAMPGLNGLEATARIAKESARTKVVILSMHADEEYVRQALRAGASAYVLKNSAPGELAQALQAVGRGETWLSSAVSPGLEDQYPAEPKTDTPPERLTSRQREVLKLLAEGNSIKQTAAKLSLSIQSVETHRANLMERLALCDIAGLVRYAVRHGVVQPKD